MKVTHAVHRLFPVPLFEFSIDDGGFNERQLTLLQALDWTDGRVGLSRTTRGDLHTDDRFAELNTMLASCFEHVRMTYGYQCNRFEVNAMWATRTSPRCKHHSHHHPNAYFSGVYTPADVPTSVMFKDPILVLRNAAIKVANSETDHSDLFSMGRVAKQGAGTVLIFPWFLQHQVAENDSDDVRYSVAFNAVPRGPIGDVDELTYLKL